MNRTSPLPLGLILLLGACETLESDTYPGQEPRYRVVETEDHPAEDVDTDEWQQSRANVLRTFALRALDQGLIEEARSYLEEACDTNPGDLAAHVTLCRLLLAEGHHESALAYATQARRYHPENPNVKLVLAAAMAENEQERDATRLLEEAWQDSQHDPELARALLTHYQSLGGEAMAHRFAQDVLDENPDNAQGWALTGDVHLSTGDLDSAADAYQEALDRDPNTPVPYAVSDKLGVERGLNDPVIASAQGAESAGDLEGAERLYRFLAESRPDDREVNAGLARVLFRMERMEEANRALARISEDDRTWREYLLESKIAISTQQWQQARESLLRTRELRPNTRVVKMLLEHVDARIVGGDNPSPTQKRHEQVAEALEIPEITEVPQAGNAPERTQAPTAAQPPMTPAKTPVASEPPPAPEAPVSSATPAPAPAPSQGSSKITDIPLPKKKPATGQGSEPAGDAPAEGDTPPVDWEEPEVIDWEDPPVEGSGDGAGTGGQEEPPSGEPPAEQPPKREEPKPAPTP